MINQLYIYLHLYTDWLYKLHFMTKYNFHQYKMASVFHGIKIGHFLLQTLMILNRKIILIDSACMIGHVAPETITGFFETLCS